MTLPPDILANAIAALEPIERAIARKDLEGPDDRVVMLNFGQRAATFKRVIDALASLRSLASAPVDTTKYYWLIERRVNPPHYATSDSHMPGWTPDPLRAYRYATKEDADDTARHLPDDIRKDAAVTQHGFMDRSLANAKGESVVNTQKDNQHGIEN